MEMPKVGDKLYLSQRTGRYYIDLVKHPYTVSEIVSPKCIKVRECQLIFNGPRYYDTFPDEIVDDGISGGIKTLKLSSSKKYNGEWITKGVYPEIATFGSWKFHPYLD